jgi:AcrR family transcriptional regulator
MVRGDTTRSEILDRALAAASETGLEALSIGVLADTVGMSKSGLFAHFGSKENLQLAVLEEGVERFARQVLAPAFKAARGEPRVRALFERWLDWEKGGRALPGGCVFIMAASEFDDRPGAVRERLVGYLEEWMENLERAARLAVEAGHFRRDLDVAQFAHDFYAIILAHHHFSRLLRHARSTARARHAFERLLADARAD